jgi:hypothetical protein
VFRRDAMPPGGSSRSGVVRHVESDRRSLCAVGDVRRALSVLIWPELPRCNAFGGMIFVSMTVVKRGGWEAGRSAGAIPDASQRNRVCQLGQFGGSFRNVANAPAEQLL